MTVGMLVLPEVKVSVIEVHGVKATAKRRVNPRLRALAAPRTRLQCYRQWGADHLVSATPGHADLKTTSVYAHTRPGESSGDT